MAFLDVVEGRNLEVEERICAGGSITLLGPEVGLTVEDGLCHRVKGRDTEETMSGDGRETLLLGDGARLPSPGGALVGSETSFVGEIRTILELDIDSSMLENADSKVFVVRGAILGGFTGVLDGTRIVAPDDGAVISSATNVVDVALVCD